jgi:polysaccharide biosynthesis/export protein
LQASFRIAQFAALRAAIVLAAEPGTRTPMTRRPAFMMALPVMLLGLLAGCHSPPAPAAQNPPKFANEEYIIGPGDKLSVFVYDNPQLSVSVPVRPDGRISTPLASDLTVVGKTPTQVEEAIAEKLKVYLREPHVTVVVEEFVGPLDRQVRVIGEATEPTALPYRDGLSVLDVMIATKGLTRFAAGNRAVIVRRGPDGKEQTIPVHLADLLKDGDISQNVAMRPGDTLIIPQSWF